MYCLLRGTCGHTDVLAMQMLGLTDASFRPAGALRATHRRRPRGEHAALFNPCGFQVNSSGETARAPRLRPAGPSDALPFNYG